MTNSKNQNENEQARHAARSHGVCGATAAGPCRLGTRGRQALPDRHARFSEGHSDIEINQKSIRNQSVPLTIRCMCNPSSHCWPAQPENAQRPAQTHQHTHTSTNALVCFRLFFVNTVGDVAGLGGLDDECAPLELPQALLSHWFVCL